jgi:hypothetical protein
MLLAAPAGVVYGLISGTMGALYEDKSLGYQVSLATSAGLIALGIGLSLLLPPRPKAASE